MIPDRWIEEATHVIGFDTSSWLLADRCRAIGRMFVLDQSIGHPRVGECVYSELRNRFPEWSDTIPRKSELHLACEDREHAAAHVIVAPSEFVRKTLLDQGVAEEKIRVIPFGTDLRMFRPAKSPPRPPMVFLYAGALTARKGVPILLAAWKRASLGPRAELWLSGSGHLPPSITKPKGVRLLGKLSRSELADAMRRAHVFVFPSLFEGLAQVQVEALATGLPVIGTVSSGAEDLVHPGETGFVLTAGSIDELANCLLELAANGDMVHTMREKCIASRWLRSWSRYGEQWFDLLSRVCVEAH